MSVLPLQLGGLFTTAIGTAAAFGHDWKRAALAYMAATICETGAVLSLMGRK